MFFEILPLNYLSEIIISYSKPKKRNQSPHFYFNEVPYFPLRLPISFPLIFGLPSADSTQLRSRTRLHLQHYQPSSPSANIRPPPLRIQKHTMDPSFR